MRTVDDAILFSKNYSVVDKSSVKSMVRDFLFQKYIEQADTKYQDLSEEERWKEAINHYKHKFPL